jgi:hypothetical protein
LTLIGFEGTEKEDASRKVKNERKDKQGQKRRKKEKNQKKQSRKDESSKRANAETRMTSSYCRQNRRVPSSDDFFATNAVLDCQLSERFSVAGQGMRSAKLFLASGGL